MTISHRWISSLAVAAAMSLITISSSAAEPVDDTALSKTVKTWDLDLAKADDVQTLQQRVRDAADAVCTAEARRYWSSTRRAAPLGWHERCVNDAVAAAVRDVDNRRLAMETTSDRALF